MLKRLLQKYPTSKVTTKPINDTSHLWLKEQHEEWFIGIPLDVLTEQEVSLLKTLFPANATSEENTLSEISKAWKSFLYENGPFPHNQMESFRFIHYYLSDIRDEFQFNEWEEAIKSLFSIDVIIVPTGFNQGVIIEDHSKMAISQEELFSAIQAFESDFFLKAYFFIGRFQTMNETVKPLFHLEHSLLELALKEHPEVRIFNREKTMPFFLYTSINEKDRDILFADVHDVLTDDPELSETIKKYIENQSNATLTAKQLFMHRNSLQYRVDKFIEKTGLDIKSFHGAFFAYLACIHVDEQ